MNVSLLRSFRAAAAVLLAASSLSAQQLPATSAPSSPASPASSASSQATAAPASTQSQPAATPPTSGQAAQTQSGQLQGSQLQPGQPQPGQPAPGSPAAPYTIRRTTRLVVLDVVVTDKKGNVVTDLKKEDFHVTEADEPQAIQNFEYPGAHPLAADVSINSTAELDKVAPRAPVNIILLDEFNTRFEDMAFARYSLKKFLEKQPGKLSTPTMLIAVDLEHFTVLKDYTQDRAAILDALDHHFVANPWRNTSRSWAGERYGTAFGTLMRVAEASVGHPGHKNMIWIGRGFPALNFQNVALDQQTRVENAVQECVNMLRDARVTLYSIDPAGLLVDQFAYGSDARFNDPFGGNYEFDRLAKATGGKALYGRNDVDAEIATGIRDGESFYTLTYRPTNDIVDMQKFRRIKVTLDRPGLVATTREGYYLARNPGRVNPEKPSRRLAFDLTAAESSTMAYDGVPITVQPFGPDPTNYRIHVDGRGVAWYNATDTTPRHAEMIVMVTTFDKKGKELKRDARSIKVKANGDVPPTGRLDRAVDMDFKVERDPKAVRARFVVRMTPTGRIGTADIDLTQIAAVAPAPSTAAQP